MKIKSLFIFGALLIGASQVQAQNKTNNDRPAKTVSMKDNVDFSSNKIRFDRILEYINAANSPEEISGLSHKVAGYIQYDIEDNEKTLDKTNAASVSKLKAKKDLQVKLTKMIGTAEKPIQVSKNDLVKFVENYIKNL